MALTFEVTTPIGPADYMRLRSAVIFREDVEKVNPDGMTIQADFELFQSKEARETGRPPMPGLKSYIVPLSENDLNEIVTLIYEKIKTYEVFQSADDI